MPALVLRPAPRRVANPKADPRFVAVTEQVKAGANKLKKHAPPAQKAREASKSAKAPPNERLAGAKAKVVDAVKEAPAPKPQPSSFKALLRAEIEKAMPKTLGDTEKFMKGEQAGAMKGSLAGNVGQQKETATGPVDAATKKAPDPGSVPATPSAALPPEPAPQAPPVAGGEAMPPPVTPAEASLQESKKDTAQALADEKIKPESLPRANDPRFSAVVAAQGQVAAQADKAPGAFRAKETMILGGAKAQASGIAVRGSLLLAGTRGRGNAQVLTRQQQQAQKEAEARQKVATDIEAIFSRTKSKVEARLANLDTEVSALFDPGVDAALNAMKSFVDDKIFKYKLERYLTIPVVGLARWLRDQALGLPAEVNAFYVQGRTVFQAAMDRLIDRVANLVETRLAQAKADVAAGQSEIKRYVAGLPANLKAAGQAAEKAVGDRFAELTTSIEDKKNELASSLAQKYKEAFDKADEALKTMQDENKGLLQQFAEKLGEVIKALLEFKAKLMAILRKGQDAIQRILDDPIAFLGNLIAAVKGGFQAFVGNIWTHLKAGFMKWLFGSLAAMGIALPTDLSLPSILKLVLDVLGITYEKMRAKAVKLIGERAVGLIEKAVEYIKEFVTGGPAKLWEKVKEDLSGLKDMVIGAIQDWLITTVVKQAVAKVVSMFNPAGAIVQAIMAIYNVVMFVIEKAQQITALVDAVVNSVHAIASGAIGSAISWIEKSLASAIPIVIGFLARLLGLGGISDKIKEFIKKVQAKVDAAIDKAIAKVVGVAKKLFGAVKAGIKNLISWWKKRQRFEVDGERHSLFFNGDAKSANLRVASTEMDLEAFIKLREKNSVLVDPIRKIRTAQGKIKALIAKRIPPKPDKAAPEDEDIAKLFSYIAKLLPRLFSNGNWGSQSNPLLMTKYPKKALGLYRPLFLGPRSSGTIKQETLATKLSAKASNPQAGFDPYKSEIAPSQLEAWINKGGRIKRYDPFTPAAWPWIPTEAAGKKIGVEPQFQIQTGSLFIYQPGDRTPGGKRINAALRKFGYSSTAQGTQGDHVLETQLIGEDRADVTPNLWPLVRTQNQHGKMLKNTPVEIPNTPPDPKIKTLEDAWEKKGKPKASLWVMIKSTEQIT